jgi:hypothetical protein
MTIRDHFFTIDHIRECAFHASHELAEQAIHCLELVTELAEAGLSFQFKGGNSLLLILETPQRFSIDVDIATDRTASAIEEVLDGIVKQYGVFTRWEKRVHKTKPWIPLSSYYLFYPSAVTDRQEVNIMLDAQMHLSPYPCERRPVVCGNLFASDTMIDLPLPASIIGDKLLTLGPQTLGIPAGKGKAAQRLKHFFDVSRLLAMNPELKAIRESFHGCLAFENNLQNRTITTEAVVRDTLECAWTVVHFTSPPRMEDDRSILSEHVDGLEPFAGHLFRERYSWVDLQYDMARAALCIAAVGVLSVTGERFAKILSQSPGESSAADTRDDSRKRELVMQYWQHIAEWFDTRTLPLQGMQQ